MGLGSPGILRARSRISGKGRELLGGGRGGTLGTSSWQNEADEDGVASNIGNAMNDCGQWASVRAGPRGRNGRKGEKAAKPPLSFPPRVQGLVLGRLYLTTRPGPQSPPHPPVRSLFWSCTRGGKR